MTFAGARSLGASICSRIFVMIFELFRRKVAGFGLHDVCGQLQHVVAGLFIDLVEADFFY